MLNFSRTPPDDVNATSQMSTTTTTTPHSSTITTTTTSHLSTTTSASTTEAELTSNGGQNTAGSDVASAADYASLRVEHGTGDVDTSTTGDDDEEEPTSGSEFYREGSQIAVADSPVEGPAVEFQELNSSNNEL